MLTRYRIVAQGLLSFMNATDDAPLLVKVGILGGMRNSTDGLIEAALLACVEEQIEGTGLVAHSRPVSAGKPGRSPLQTQNKE